MSLSLKITPKLFSITLFSISLLTRKRKSLFIFLLSWQFFTGNAAAQDTPIYSSEAIFHPVIAKNGMVASQEELATEAGLEVLKEGGNAIDAAVTIGFTLAVTLPRAGNLGGGGFMLIHLAEAKETIAIDYREKAPLAATRDMFLDQNGEVDVEKSRFSHLAVGVPGTVAGMVMVLEKYGTISLARALQPAIELAENGFPVDEDLRNTLILAKDRMQASPASMEIFYQEGGVYDVGEILVQKDLAKSLKLIAREGAEAFYQGAIASAIVADMEANGGLITKEDLANYQPVIRQPIRGNYRGYEIYSMPPPSSGGVHLVQMLNILEKFPIRFFGHNTAKTIHLMAETMKLAYADRFKFLGDSDFVPVPINRLISKSYADVLRTKINPNRAIPSREILPGETNQLINESTETTHYSVIDRYGNAVANTYTLNFSYGTGLTVPGTGILLNNEMDDFTAKLGVPNAYGLIGGKFNAIEPEKRMLSSMTPTIVIGEGKPFLVTGSPGGSRIITTTLQVIMNVIDHQMNIAEATNAVRVHHQWLPDELRFEQGLNGDTIRLLTGKGYKVVDGNAMGSTQSIMSVDDIFYGASDPRRPGALTLGY